MSTIGITAPNSWIVAPNNMLTHPDIHRYGWKYQTDAQTIDENYMDLAYRIARNSYCMEGNMGSVFVRDIPLGSGHTIGSVTTRGTVIAQSINSALVKRFHSECHAEANAVSACCRHGISLAGTTCYVTRAPCTNCYRLIATAGVIRIVCPQDPASEECLESVAKLGIEWIKIRQTQDQMQTRDEEASKHEDNDRVQLLRQERKLVREQEKVKSRKRKAQKLLEMQQKQEDKQLEKEKKQRKQ